MVRRESTSLEQGCSAMTWFPRLLGIGTAGAGAVVVLPPEPLASACGPGDSDWNLEPSTAVRCRCSGVRAPSRDTLRPTAVARVMADFGDATVLDLLPSDSQRRNIVATLVAGRVVLGVERPGHRFGRSRRRSCKAGRRPANLRSGKRSPRWACDRLDGARAVLGKRYCRKGASRCGHVLTPPGVSARRLTIRKDSSRSPRTCGAREGVACKRTSITSNST